MKAWLPVGLVLLLGLGLGCNGRKAEEARAAAARAQEEAARRAENDKKAAALKEALDQVTASLSPAKARDDFKLVRAKAPARHHEALAKLEACQADGVEEVQKAAETRAYATIATVAVGCIASMEDLMAESRRALLRELLSDKGSKDDGGLELLKLQKATHEAYCDVMILLLDHGPEDARRAAFDAAAAEHAKRTAAGTTTETLAAVLQRAHKGENTPESKVRMAARLKELGVPLEAASPAPPAAGAGS